MSCLGSGIPSLVGGLGSKVHLSVMEDGLCLLNRRCLVVTGLGVELLQNINGSFLHNVFCVTRKDRVCEFPSLIISYSEKE